jgi:hypothetical protein
MDDDDMADGDLPAEFSRFKYPLNHLAKALNGEARVKIIALGSSSTAGRADVVPYPARLEMYLRAEYAAAQFPNLRIDVLNRGQGGEEAIEELQRFDADIFAENPSLLIWQIGTNAVFHSYDLDRVKASIDQGLAKLSGRMDVVLIDPQYVPAMLFDDKADAAHRMVSLIGQAAELAKVNLFRRWALMRHWHVHNRIGLPRMVDPTDPDQLHQSDWSTQRFAQALRDAIVSATPRWLERS